ncbi:MAG: hypothetical protein A2Y64_07460 [Candidatus Coatesbacteria bacterium RBG_13_66_14]|uniref:Uncharacterized protein n=1 Tax=Candidatus Coatesbacteria bacterium RBG_13_66_14 TaxID=1817816 RepID=A0A1F5F719_9BACT|nr:MAG: hypothetical protein A2Y64_07460 [Candidatus Coatesbacteria bacterium RBG_13_66_14]
MKIRVALSIALGLCLTLASCGEEEKPEGETAPEETAVEETPAPAYAVGETVWATYFDPQYVTALTWEKTTVIAVEGDAVTVEFHGFLNEGEQATRGVEWIHPYVEVWKPEKAVLGATVVVEPPGTSFVAYPGVIEKIEEGTYTVGYEVDGVPHADGYTLAELH